MKLGFSGRLTRATIRSPLTPLFLLAALAAGLVALLTIPREEEPQISVPMVDIVVAANGLKAPDAAELVTKPLETIVKAIAGVEHVYSQTQDDRAVVTVRFVVGTNEDDAVLRVNDKIRANFDRIPIGVPEPLIVGHGINDVAIVALTLSPTAEAAGHWTDKDLYDLAAKLRTELTKVGDIGTSFIVGTGPEEIRVEPDPEKLSLFGVTLQQLIGKVRDANREFVAGSVRDAGTTRTLAAGQTLRGVPDIGLLLLTTRDGRPVYVRDVAKIVVAPSVVDSRVWTLTSGKDDWVRAPAVSVALAKRAGANAVVVSQAIIDRVEALKGRLIPSDIAVEVTRDYGRTANDKANELLFHLGLATVSIVVLIAVAVGWREAVVTLVVIPTTILLTDAGRAPHGLHDQSRQPVRADILHWDPGRRRNRSRGEHRPPLGDARQPPADAGRDRGGRGGWQSNGRRHADSDRGAAANAVRLRTDGAVYGAHPGQCLLGNAVLVLCCDGRGALADAKVGAACRGRGWRGIGAHRR